ncbi:MAG: sodium ion-translocating decarboxylase subunit beta [Clostridiales bacterium]|nr:sodium ion-translocating decarboxylase subunit beta [Clostridiales bacterium]MCC8100595.1 sodium ion-translocating decarboxylase subunit beta [Clostridiales bacterium]
MEFIGTIFSNLAEQTGFAAMAESGAVGTIKTIIMLAIACVLLYLGIVKKYEPLLLVGIAFGMLLTNLPGSGIYTPELWYAGSNATSISFSDVLHEGGFLDILYIGVKLGIYPSLIFMGVGAMTDFGPMMANPKSMLLGAAAQFGVYFALLMAVILGFDGNVAASIAIIGGADGPTAIWLTTQLAPNYLGAIAIAAYSYMALIPVIQPPFMKLLVKKENRQIKMEQLRPVSQTEKIVFPIVVTIVCCLIIPSVASLLGCLMLGNLWANCGVCDRLSDTAQNALMNIVTIFLGISVGATATADQFLKVETLLIIVLGLIAFCFATIGGLLVGNLMCYLTHGKINPLIGSAGVSAVPMAARVAQVQGQKDNPSNFLLMHAMGPNVAGVIGSAVAAGFLLAVFG